jgi:hypothetical protein
VGRGEDVVRPDQDAAAIANAATKPVWAGHHDCRPFEVAYFAPVAEWPAQGPPIVIRYGRSVTASNGPHGQDGQNDASCETRSAILCHVATPLPIAN